MGYSTYLTFLFGYVSTLVTVYYLAIKNVPSLQDLFPRFIPFAVLATVIGAPLSIAVGWIHLKRSPAYRSEADILVESNPYNYKLPPGFSREVIAPWNLEILLMLKRSLHAQGLLDDKDKSRLDDLERKLKLLIEGGMVGTPRTKI
jgi:hypothetical protein